VFIRIYQEEYKKGLYEVQNALRGRLTLSTGDNSYSVHNLVTKLGKLWKTGGKWKMVSLGKGYFDFHFDVIEDIRQIWTAGTINLIRLILLSQWTKYFNFHSQKQTHASIWIRLIELLQEY